MRTGITQQSPTANPKVTVTVSSDVFTSEGGGGSERVVSVWSDELAWGGQYIIELDNSDEALNAKDYKGSEVTLNFNFIGETGSDLPPIWVHNQAFISREGKLLLVLNCIDAWGLLSQVVTTLIGAAYNQEWQQTANLDEMTLPSGEDIPQTLKDAITANYGKTIYEIVTDFMDTIGKTVVIDGGDDDGIIQTRKPPLGVSNLLAGTRQLMEMTECYLLWVKEGGIGKFRVIKPDAHGTAYSYNVANLFFSNIEDAAIAIPNRVTFWAFDETGENWISGVANDTTSQGKIGIIPRHYLLANMQIDARASAATLTALAEGALVKIQGERSQGTLVAPLHCSQELFDKISIVDDRYGTPRTTTGYVHRITREYGRGVYQVTIQLGGVTSGYVPPGGGLPTPLAEAEAPQAPLLRPPTIGAYIADVEFTSIAYNAISWGAGIVRLADGRTQSILEGNLALTATHYLYAILGNNVLQNSTSASDAVGQDRMLVAVASIASTTAQKAYVLNPHTDSILINTDKVMDGLVTALKLANNAVTANKIYAGAVTAIKIDVATLDAISANVGTLTAGIINGVTIYAGAGSIILDVNGIKVTGLGKFVLDAGTGTVMNIKNLGDIRFEDDQGTPKLSYIWQAHGGGWPDAHVIYSQNDILLYPLTATLTAPNMEIGPWADTMSTLYFRTRNKDGSLNNIHHAFCPSGKNIGYLGKHPDNYWANAYIWHIYAADIYPYMPASNTYFGTDSWRWTWGYFNKLYANTRLQIPVGASMYD